MQYEFDTTIGEGSVIVTVVMTYERDEEGTYNENIDEVWFEGRNVIGLFSAVQYKEIEIEGCMRLQKHILDEKEHSDTVDYDLRGV